MELRARPSSAFILMWWIRPSQGNWCVQTAWSRSFWNVTWFCPEIIHPWSWNNENTLFLDMSAFMLFDPCFGFMCNSPRHDLFRGPDTPSARTNARSTNLGLPQSEQEASQSHINDTLRCHETCHLEIHCKMEVSRWENHLHMVDLPAKHGWPPEGSTCNVSQLIPSLFPRPDDVRITVKPTPD